MKSWSRSRRAAPFPITTTRARRHCSCPSRSTGRAPSPRPRSPLTRRATRFRCRGYVPLQAALGDVPRRCVRLEHVDLASIIGVLLNALNLIGLALIIYAVAVAFHIVTLPVEFNASSRAAGQLRELGLVGPGGEQAGVKSVLNAAALTYVAGALAALTSFCTTRSSSSATATEAERGLRWSPPRPTRSHTPSRRRSSPARSSRDRSSARSPFRAVRRLANPDS